MTQCRARSLEKHPPVRWRLAARILAAAGSLCCAGYTFAGAAGTDATLRLSPGEFAPGLIGETELRLQVVPDGASLILTAESARRAKLSSWLGPQLDIHVGPVAVQAEETLTFYRVAGLREWGLVVWTEAPLGSDADGELGPGDLRQDTVSFKLRDPQAEETLYSLPLVAKHGQGLGTESRVGNEDLFVNFSFRRRETLVTAEGAAVLARANGAKWNGPVATMPIVLGARRPVRPLHLANPWVLGPFQVSDLTGRLGDYGDSTKVAETDPGGDSDEVVVTGKQDRAEYTVKRITLGTDALASCSEVTFDKARHKLLLSCVPQSVK